MNDKDTQLQYSDDVGLRDFKFGASGLLFLAVLAILFAIIF
jgi:hypothetical protein